MGLACLCICGVARDAPQLHRPVQARPPLQTRLARKLGRTPPIRMAPRSADCAGRSATPRRPPSPPRRDKNPANAASKLRRSMPAHTVRHEPPLPRARPLGRRSRSDHPRALRAPHQTPRSPCFDGRRKAAVRRSTRACSPQPAVRPVSPTAYSPLPIAPKAPASETASARPTLTSPHACIIYRPSLETRT